MSDDHWIVRVARHLPPPDIADAIVAIVMVAAFFLVVWWL
jgi:hypothetical protein